VRPGRLLASPETARQSFGGFSADVPADWTVGDDGSLLAIYPPYGESVIQISTYRGPPRHEPSAAELLEFAEPSMTPEKWHKDPPSVRQIADGYFAIDLETSDEGGLSMLYGYRLWRGRLLLATYTYAAEDVHFLPDARSLIESIEPAPA
jgi:hypothetical protein